MISLRPNIQLIVRPEEKNRKKSKKENYRKNKTNPKLKTQNPNQTNTKQNQLCSPPPNFPKVKTMNLKAEKAHVEPKTMNEY